MCAACPANCMTCQYDETATKLTCRQCYDKYQKTNHGTCDCASILLYFKFFSSVHYLNVFYICDSVVYYKTVTEIINSIKEVDIEASIPIRYATMLIAIIIIF